MVGFALPAFGWTVGTTNHVWILGGRYYSSPAIGTNGLIYVGSTSGMFYALSPAGATQQVWHTEDKIFSSPSIGADGTLYVGNDANRLYAFNPDGTTQHIWEVPDRIVGIPAIARDGTVYAGVQDGNLYAFNPDGTTGRTWHADSSSFVSSPAIDNNGMICIGGYSIHMIYAFNPDGTTQQVWDTAGKIEASPAIGSNGTVYVGAGDASGSFYAFLQNGTTQHVWTLGGEIYSSAAIADNGTIYVATYGASSTTNWLFALNPNGTTQRIWTLPRPAYSSPALGSDGTIYIGCNGGGNHNFFAFHPDGTTSIVWNLKAADGYRIQGSPAIGLDGTVYIGNYDSSEFYALPGTGGKLMDAPWPKFAQNMFNSQRALVSPSDLTASSLLYDDRIELAWSLEPYASGYQVWRGTNALRIGALPIASVQTPAYSDTSAQAMRRYYYWVRSTNSVFMADFNGSATGRRRCYVVPTNGPHAGGNVILLTNGLLSAGGMDVTNIIIGGFATNPVAQGTTWVRFRAPAGPTSVVNITIQSAAFGSTELPSCYQYNGAGRIGVDQMDEWTEVRGLSQLRDLAGGGVLHGALYAMGGVIGSVHTNVYRFDGITWAEVAGLPDMRYDMGSAVYSNRLYCLGGYRTTYSTTNVYVFDGTNWSEIVGLPAPRKAMAAAALNGIIYVAGGQNLLGGAGETNVYRYNGSSWAEVRGLPARRYAAAGCAWEDQFYVIGGYNISGVAQTNILRFDGTNWTEFVGLPEAQAYAGAAVLNGQLHVFGGTTSSNVYRYDGTNWITGTPMPGQRRGFVGGELNGAYHAAGGADSTLTARTNMFHYRPRVFIPGTQPCQGPITGNYQVVISGSNLCNGGLSDVTDVRLCGASAVILNVSSTQILIQAGMGLVAGAGDVVVVSVSHGTTVGSNMFTYTAPGIAVLGTNGVVVTNQASPSISQGTDFQYWRSGQMTTNRLAITNSGTMNLVISGASLNGAPPNTFQLRDLPALVSPGAASNFWLVFAPMGVGTYTSTLAIANNAGGPASNYRIQLIGHSYLLNPGSGSAAGGNPVTITNGLLGSGMDITNVLVGGTSAVIVAQGANWVRVIMPAHASGLVNVVVESASQGGILLASAYTYNAAGLQILAVAGPHGVIHPSGLISVPSGGSTSFIATADAYYHIGVLRTNGVADTEATLRTVYTSVWNNVTATGMVEVTFAANLTTNTGTPEWWLAQYNLTNDFASEAIRDQDNDGLFTWEEQVSDTVPTNAQSCFQMVDMSLLGAGSVLAWDSVTGRVYYLQVSPDAMNSFWPSPVNATNIPATPDKNVWTNPPSVMTNSLLFFRLGVRSP